jgi:hypothetical protein
MNERHEGRILPELILNHERTKLKTYRLFLKNIDRPNMYNVGWVQIEDKWLPPKN